jgi:hypothetical protein
MYKYTFFLPVVFLSAHLNNINTAFLSYSISPSAFQKKFVCFFVMVYFSKIATAVAAACLASTAIAHPGEHHDHAAIKREIVARNQMASAAKRSIDSCSSSLKHRELNARSIARRAETLHSIRKARGIKSSK